jgi:hypothetical protein
MRLFIGVLGAGVFLAVLGMAMVLSSAQGQPFTAAMMRCGEAFYFAGPHMANFSSDDEAKRWADGQLAGAFDIAYIYRPEGPGLLSNLLWIKSESVECYGNQFRDWTRP